MSTLKITNKKTGEQHIVRKYIFSEEGEQSIWSNSWYGRHVIGQDCEWVSPVPAVGAVWVKASERLPDIFDSHEKHYRIDGKKVEGGRIYKSPSGYFIFEYRHHSGFITDEELSSVEWLDESASDGIGELEREVDRLKELIYIAHMEGADPFSSWAEFKKQHNL